MLATDRSAGHIFPAWTLVEPLSREHRVYLFATSSYFKKKLFPGRCIFLGRELDRRNIFLEMCYRAVEALIIIWRVRPSWIIGFGGRGSFFLILWGKLFKTRISIYEPNLTLGKANKLLVSLADDVYTGFSSASRSRFKAVGIPVRQDLACHEKRQARIELGLDPDLPVIFFFGGSQGSKVINSLCREFVVNCPEKVQVIHLTGAEEYYNFRQFYDKIIKNPYFVRDFYQDMGLLYSAADIVVSRAGASTIAEISWFGLPAVFIPLPGAGAHQVENARFLQQQKAACLLLQEEASADRVREKIGELLENDFLRNEMVSRLKACKLWVKADDFCRFICAEKKYHRQ